MPSLDDIKAQVCDSSIEDWNVILCWGANSGPSFLDDFSVWKGGEGTWGLEHDRHAIRAAYTPDVSLGLAYGLEYMQNEALTYEWAKFADATVKGRWIDVFHNGMLVDRQLMLSVDGGRAILPAPSAEFTPDLGNLHREVFAESVTPWEFHLARLAHSFERDEETFHEYFAQAGFHVIDD